MALKYCLTFTICLFLGGIQLVNAQNMSYPVKLDVYYESLCMDSMRFFRNQLSEAYPLLNEIMDVTLYPYGKANDSCSDSGCTFTCQHGPDECEGNKILACARNFYDKDSNIRFNICVMSKINPPTAGEQCAQDLGLPFTEVSLCSSLPQGEMLLHDIGVETHSLSPPLTYVPWLVTDGDHTTKLQVQAQFNLTSHICSEYQGETPPACVGHLW